MKPDVTIFADASLSADRKHSSWACWMKSDAVVSSIYSARFKQNIWCVASAELAALANALIVADKRGYLFQNATVLLQSDSLSALGVILSGADAVNNISSRHQSLLVSPKRPTKFQQAILSRLVEVQLRHSLKLQVRHVKGHSSKPDGRYGVNNLCDRLAKEARRNRR